MMPTLIPAEIAERLPYARVRAFLPSDRLFADDVMPLEGLSVPVRLAGLDVTFAWFRFELDPTDLEALQTDPHIWIATAHDASGIRPFSVSLHPPQPE